MDVGQSCHLAFQFSPTAAGDRKGKFEAADGLVTAVINVAGKGLLAKLDISPKTWNFGTVAFGNSSTKLFTLKNNGTYTSGGIGPGHTGSGDFSLVVGGGTCTGAPLAPGQSCTFTNKFEPSTPAAGLETATIFAVAGPGETGQSAVLTGTGA